MHVYLYIMVMGKTGFVHSQGWVALSALWTRHTIQLMAGFLLPRHDRSNRHNCAYTQMFNCCEREENVRRDFRLFLSVKSLVKSEGPDPAIMRVTTQSRGTKLQGVPYWCMLVITVDPGKNYGTPYA